MALFLYRNTRSQKLTPSNKTLFQAWVTLPILWITKTVNKTKSHTTLIIALMIL